MEQVKVGHDGYGGIVVLEASDRVFKAILRDGLHDVVESDQINVPGVFNITLSEYYESCDCGGGYPCGHDDYPIFEVKSTNRLGDLVAPK